MWIILLYLQLSNIFTTSAATNLFVTSAKKFVYTLKLTETNGVYNLENTNKTDACGQNPTWITLDASHTSVYCINEGIGVKNGSITSFDIIDDAGNLQSTALTQTYAGPVYGEVLRNNFKARLAVPLYGNSTADGQGSALASYGLLENRTQSVNLQSQGQHFFHLDKPGPVSPQQVMSHPHQAAMDPTGQFLIVPDLGADLLRIFKIDRDDLSLMDNGTFAVAPGSGPRHVVFYSPSGVYGGASTLLLYVLAEIANTVTAYNVTNNNGQINFSQVWNSSVFGDQLGTVPQYASAAEVAISPDQQFLLISNRNDSFTNSSDSISTFSLNKNGTASFVERAAVGGSCPRHFELNHDGSLVAVALRKSFSVTILSRDVKTGHIGGPVASVGIDSDPPDFGPTCVRWR